MRANHNTQKGSKPLLTTAAILKWTVSVALFVFIIFTLHSTYKIALIGSGYYAKTLCSSLFISNRMQDHIIEEDVQADMLPILRRLKPQVDAVRQTVSVSFIGLARQTAVHRKGLGCALAIDRSIDQIQLHGAEITNQPHLPDDDKFWPVGSKTDRTNLPPGVNQLRLQAAIDDAFDEPDQFNLRRTRAVVVVHKGRIVGERYAPGFDSKTPQLGWSMTKSVMNALTGILVHENRLDIEAKNLLQEWRTPDDARSQIKLDHLLRMTSGLEFGEDYDAMLSDVRIMLFLTGDQAGYASLKQLNSAPGTLWYYSSGTSNILSKVIRQAIAGPLPRYLLFPQVAFFDRLGLTTAVIETDAAGHFVGSSYMYASARDWAKIGLLYLRDGMWEGERILPEGWVSYSTRPTTEAGEYGAGFWLKLPEFLKSRHQSHTPIPPGTYYMLGHDGQMVAIIPSKELVVVRLGLSRRKFAWSHDTFLSNVISAFHQGEGAKESSDLTPSHSHDRDRGRIEALPVP